MIGCDLGGGGYKNKCHRWKGMCEIFGASVGNVV